MHHSAVDLVDTTRILSASEVLLEVSELERVVLIELNPILECLEVSRKLVSLDFSALRVLFCVLREILHE